MTPQEALALCEATVRRSDADRYFASLFAPAEKRPLLFALYAFNVEIARIGQTIREPMMGAIRLQWWREALEAARDGRPRAQPAAIGLAEIFACASPPQDLFESLIDAHGQDMEPAPFSSLESLEVYARATSATLMRIAAHILDLWADAEIAAREAGIACGLTETIRSLPQQIARGRVPLPADILAAEGLSAADALSGTAALTGAVARIADRAREHLAKAREIPIPRAILPALLPASLVPAYLSNIARTRDRVEISQLRRQFVLLRAATLGRL